jgi:hypothetical protein
MPAHALVHFPNIATTGINALRDDYDPYKDLIDVHIAVMASSPTSGLPHGNSKWKRSRRA